MKGYTINEMMKWGYWHIPYIPFNITTMENNEISKLLYKQNPKATLSYIRKGNAYYSTTVEDAVKGSVYVQFEVPIIDMGDADFFPEMEGKYLRRWILK